MQTQNQFPPREKLGLTASFSIHQIIEENINLQYIPNINQDETNDERIKISDINSYKLQNIIKPSHNLILYFRKQST